MLGAGHVADYLFYWRNLYRQSQQGWESFNSMLKNVFVKRTARGGSAGGKYAHGNTSRLVPVAKWLLRRESFYCGLQKEDLKKEYNNDTDNNEEAINNVLYMLHEENV